MTTGTSVAAPTQAWTKERLAEAKARCDAATPGPWGWTPGSGDAEDADECACVQSTDGSMEIEAGDKEPSFSGDADAAFIAYARTDLPDALAEIERGWAEIERLRAELAARPAPAAEASLEARAEDARDAYFADLNEHQSREEQPRSAWLAVVRAVDASRPSPTREQVADALDALAEAPEIEWRDPSILRHAAAIARGVAIPTDASRPGLTEQRCRHCRATLPDHTPVCAIVHIAQEDGFPTISAAYEQWVTRNNGEPRGEASPVPTVAIEGLGPEPGILAPAASDPGPPTAAGHVSIPRAVLSRLVDATLRDESVREPREAAEHVLHLDSLRHEPARHDPEAARAAALVAPHDRYLHDGPRETCPLPSCATPDPPSPADPLSALPAEERTRILDLAAEAHRKAFGFGDAASAAYYDTIRREVTAYHTRGPRCPDSGCEHPDHTRADEESGQ
jgi:hypothetical protein